MHVRIANKVLLIFLVASVALCITGFALKQVTSDSKNILSESCDLYGHSSVQWQHSCVGPEVGKVAVLVVEARDRARCVAPPEVDLTVTIIIDGIPITTQQLTARGGGICGENSYETYMDSMSQPVGNLEYGTLIEVTVSIVKGDSCTFILVEQNPEIDSLVSLYDFLGWVGIVGIIFTVLLTVGFAYNIKETN